MKFTCGDGLGGAVDVAGTEACVFEPSDVLDVGWCSVEDLNT